MEKRVRFASDRTDFGDGLNGADFTVGVHDADHDRVRPNCASQFAEVHEAVLLRSDAGHLDAAFAFELFKDIEDGLVFTADANDMVAAIR